MPHDRTGARHQARRELNEYWDRFTAEEEGLFSEGRYAEVATRLRDRARQQYLKALAVLISTEFVPVIYIVVAVLVLELDLWTALGGFVLLFLLFGVLPVRVFRDRHRMKKAATRAWAAAFEAENGPVVEGADLTELVGRMDDLELRMLREGRLRELADRIERSARRGIRFMTGFRYVLGGLVVAVPVTALLLGGRTAAFATWPLVLAAAALLVMAVALRRELVEKARVADELRES